MDIIKSDNDNCKSKLTKSRKRKKAASKTVTQNEKHIKPTLSESDEFMKLEKAVVKYAKGFYLHVDLESERKGRIHITEISDNVINGSRPLTTFHRDQDLTVITLGATSVKSDEGLVITKAHVRQTYIDCSLRESVKSEEENALDRTFAVGDTVVGFVCKHTRSWVHFYLTPTVIGVVNLINLSYNFKIHDPKNLKRHFKKGHAYSARIIKKRKKYFEMSLIRPEDMKSGAIVAGRILSTRREFGLLLKLPLDYKGKVHLTDMCDTYQYSVLLLADLFKNNIVKCALLDVDTSSKDAVVSVRDSRIGKLEDSNAIYDKEYELNDFHVNMEVRGFVVSVSKKRLFVVIARDVMAICPNNRSIPSYLQVRGAVIRLQISKVENDVIHGNVVLSKEDELMKNAIANVEELSKKRQSDFEESQAKRLKTSNEESFSEEVEIENSWVIDVCPDKLEERETEITEKPGSTLTSNETVLQDCSVATQESSVTADVQDSSVKLTKLQEKKLRKKAKKVLTLELKKKESEKLKNQNIPHVDCNRPIITNQKVKIQETAEIQNEKNKPLAHLELSTGFVWDLNSIQSKNENEDSSEDESDGDKATTKKIKLTRYLKEKSEEDRLRNAELLQLDSTRAPETVDDFDKLVLGSPNSSVIWVSYMAFHLQSTEIDKARTIAERALKTISFREEQEKLNVWVALLNLENDFGSPESLQKVFQRALQYNDPMKIYHRVTKMYIDSNKREAAEQLYGIMIKKFSTEIEVWINYAIFLMKDGQMQAAHRLMDRSLKSLAKKDHVSLISKFAQLEFKYGSAERANSLFESILASYPKRTDIWVVYVDALVKSGHIEKARDIYRKALTVAHAFKKMKFFFPKYLAFEKLHGNNESLNYAKDKLLEFEQLDKSKFNVDMEDD